MKDNNSYVKFEQFTRSQHINSQYNDINVYPNLECVMCPQLYDISCFGCDNTDCKVSDKKVHNNFSIHTYTDNNKAFDIRNSEYVSSDTVTDIPH